MLNLIGETHIPFLKGRFFAYGFSALVLAIGIFTFLGRGNNNFGVEFTGGTSMTLQFKTPVDIAVLRKELEGDGLKGLVIQHYGELKENQFIVKAAEKDTERIEKVARQLSQDQFEVLQVDRVGPTVSQDLTQKALLAVLWASIGILVYLGWRFEWKFALAAVIALLHDTLFAFGVYALSGREINLPTIAAILTIMGYSVNDTIVNFDRIRDNLK